MQKKDYTNEANEVLKKITELLLDENAVAKVETTYHRTTKNNAIELTTKPGIPTDLGAYTYIGDQSVNAKRARSVKIGKYTMCKWPNGAGYRITTPEGEIYQFPGDLTHRITTASYIWAAALAKCDKHYSRMLYYLSDLQELGTTTPQMTKGPSKTKFEEAQAQLEALGIPKKSQVRLNKIHEGRE